MFSLRLRVKLTMHRCRISIQHLPVLILDSLPLVGISKKPISKLSENTIYMKLLKHPGFYLIYELKQVRPTMFHICLGLPPSLLHSKLQDLFPFSPQNGKSIESKFYMLKAKACRYVNEGESTEMDTHGAQLYLQPSHFMELDKFMLLRGPTTPLDENSLSGESLMGLN